MSKPHESNKHHRRARSNGGDSSPRNISVVNKRQHVFFHGLFSDTRPEAIARELNAKWVDPDYIIIAIPKEDARKALKHLSQLT